MAMANLDVIGDFVSDTSLVEGRAAWHGGAFRLWCSGEGLDVRSGQVLEEGRRDSVVAAPEGFDPRRTVRGRDFEVGANMGRNSELVVADRALQTRLDKSVESSKMRK